MIPRMILAPSLNPLRSVKSTAGDRPKVRLNEFPVPRLRPMFVLDASLHNRLELDRFTVLPTAFDALCQSQSRIGLPMPKSVARWTSTLFLFFFASEHHQTRSAVPSY